MWSKKNLKSIVMSIMWQKNFLSQKSSQLFGTKLPNILSIIVICWLILVDYGKHWPIIVEYGQSKVFLVHFSGLLVHLRVFFFREMVFKYMSIVKYFFSFFSQFFLKIVLSSQLFTQLLLEVKYQGNDLLNYYWKSNVKAITFSIITWSGLVKSGFELSLGTSLDSEGEDWSRV